MASVYSQEPKPTLSARNDGSRALGLFNLAEGQGIEAQLDRAAAAQGKIASMWRTVTNVIVALLVFLLLKGATVYTSITARYGDFIAWVDDCIANGGYDGHGGLLTAMALETPLLKYLFVSPQIPVLAHTMFASPLMQTHLQAPYGPRILKSTVDAYVSGPPDMSMGAAICRGVTALFCGESQSGCPDLTGAICTLQPCPNSEATPISGSLGKRLAFSAISSGTNLAFAGHMIGGAMSAGGPAGMMAGFVIGAGVGLLQAGLQEASRKQACATAEAHCMPRAGSGC